MKMRVLGVALLVLLLVAPAVQAGPQPALYFLKDDALKAAEDGILNTTRPNATQPSLRVVPVAGTDVVPVRFLSPEGASHPDRLLGPVYVGLWMGPSPIVKGNLTVTVTVLNGTQSIPVGNASLRLDANASKLPHPTQLVPPNPTPSTSDPSGWALSVVYYELAQILPAVTPPGQLLYVGSIDKRVNATAQIVVSFTITPGDSGLPVAQGPAATLQYNASLFPSFVYVPWYAPNPPTPPRPTYNYYYNPPGTTAKDPTGSSAEDPAAPKAKGSGLPGPDVAALLVGLAALGIAIARRRR